MEYIPPRLLSSWDYCCHVGAQVLPKEWLFAQYVNNNIDVTLNFYYLYVQLTKNLKNEN